MIGVSVKVSGMSLTKRQLKACARYLPFEMHKATRDIVVKGEGWMKGFAPVDSGETRNRIVGRMFTGTSGAIGTTDDPAKFGAIDQGSKPHVILPKDTQAMTLPFKDKKSGKYTSMTKKKKSGGFKQFRGVQYTDASAAPNKRHMNVWFAFAKRVNHPGSRGWKFVERTAKRVRPYSTIRSRRAVEAAISKAGGGNG